MRQRESGDPFDCLPLDRLVTGAPIVRRAAAAFDCEVVRHLDMEADHELYIGHVLASCEFEEEERTNYACTPRPAWEARE